VRIVHPDRQDKKGFQQSAQSDFEARTKALEDSAREAALKEREQSQRNARETRSQRKARSAFDSGKVPPGYRLDPSATNSQAWGGWEWKHTEAVVTGKAYSPPRPRCACCDAELPPARSDARFCSNACRQKSYRLRNAEARA
jgi:hypothetical protein